jgi:hypothetical protein
MAPDLNLKPIILVVDDEAVLVMHAVDIFREAGFTENHDRASEIILRRCVSSKGLFKTAPDQVLRISA